MGIPENNQDETPTPRPLSELPTKDEFLKVLDLIQEIPEGERKDALLGTVFGLMGEYAAAQDQEKA